MKIQKNWIILLLLGGVFSNSLFGQKIEKTIRVEQGYSPRNDIRSIQFDADGIMWIGTGDGILKKEEKGAFEWNASLGNCYVKEVKIDASNHLWVSLWPGGLHRSRDKGQTWDRVADFGNAPVMSVLSGNQGTHYVATWGMGIYKFTNRWTKVGPEKPYEKGVNAILKDSDGFLWIASYLGLVRYDETSDKAKIYTSLNSSLPSKNIYKLAYDRQRNVWAGTDCGLANLTQELVYTTHNSPLPAPSILSLYCPTDKYGIWVGTSKGLAFYNGKSWYTWTIENSDLVGDKIQCIIEKEGKIYVGTDKGINIITYP